MPLAIPLAMIRRRSIWVVLVAAVIAALVGIFAFSADSFDFGDGRDGNIAGYHDVTDQDEAATRRGEKSRDQSTGEEANNDNHGRANSAETSDLDDDYYQDWVQAQITLDLPEEIVQHLKSRQFACVFLDGLELELAGIFFDEDGDECEASIDLVEYEVESSTSDCLTIYYGDYEFSGSREKYEDEFPIIRWEINPEDFPLVEKWQLRGNWGDDFAIALNKPRWNGVCYDFGKVSLALPGKSWLPMYLVRGQLTLTSGIPLSNLQMLGLDATLMGSKEDTLCHFYELFDEYLPVDKDGRFEVLLYSDDALLAEDVVKSIVLSFSNELGDWEDDDHWWKSVPVTSDFQVNAGTIELPGSLLTLVLPEKLPPPFRFVPPSTESPGALEVFNVGSVDLSCYALNDSNSAECKWSRDYSPSFLLNEGLTSIEGLYSTEDAGDFNFREPRLILENTKQHIYQPTFGGDYVKVNVLQDGKPINYCHAMVLEVNDESGETLETISRGYRFRMIETLQEKIGPYQPCPFAKVRQSDDEGEKKYLSVWTLEREAVWACLSDTDESITIDLTNPWPKDPLQHLREDSGVSLDVRMSGTNAALEEFIEGSFYVVLHWVDGAGQSGQSTESLNGGLSETISVAPGRIKLWVEMTAEHCSQWWQWGYKEPVISGPVEYDVEIKAGQKVVLPQPEDPPWFSPMTNDRVAGLCGETNVEYWGPVVGTDGREFFYTDGRHATNSYSPSYIRDGDRQIGLQWSDPSEAKGYRESHWPPNVKASFPERLRLILNRFSEFEDTDVRISLSNSRCGSIAWNSQSSSFSLWIPKGKATLSGEVRVNGSLIEFMREEIEIGDQLLTLERSIEFEERIQVTIGNTQGLKCYFRDESGRYMDAREGLLPGSYTLSAEFKGIVLYREQLDIDFNTPMPLQLPRLDKPRTGAFILEYPETLDLSRDAEFNLGIGRWGMFGGKSEWFYSWGDAKATAKGLEYSGIPIGKWVLYDFITINGDKRYIEPFDFDISADEISTYKLKFLGDERLKLPKLIKERKVHWRLYYVTFQLPYDEDAPLGSNFSGIILWDESGKSLWTFSGPWESSEEYSKALPEYALKELEKLGYLSG